MADNKANHNSMNHLSGRRGNLHKLIKAEMMTGYKLRLPLHGTSTQIVLPPTPFLPDIYISSCQTTGKDDMVTLTN